ncbi:unnamed protein product [Triticum turgidum subsp. durum]|uniref:Uncharacterized protein n=1 Tax=Triticum turgidum subsp. durum TaxID=4567 RepID=A0A9R1NSK0_TRITD|nr:unnamed protein product [Triticum turgidum subsp. durum]
MAKGNEGHVNESENDATSTYRFRVLLGTTDKNREARGALVRMELRSLARKRCRGSNGAEARPVEAGNDERLTESAEVEATRSGGGELHRSRKDCGDNHGGSCSCWAMKIGAVPMAGAEARRPGSSVSGRVAVAASSEGAGRRRCDGGTGGTGRGSDAAEWEDVTRGMCAAQKEGWDRFGPSGGGVEMRERERSIGR